MIKKIKLLFIIFLLIAIEKKINAQTDSLNNVTVTAFNLQSKWQDAPVAVAVINKAQLQLLNNVSLVPILNTIPGVRMEERSPGSYRLSIRGSLLRSPYGVRNVKVYWKDIPLTDAGGNTYLQLVDISQLQSVEIIKGPASSLYGANTGGAVILNPGNLPAIKKNIFNAAINGGSYNLFNQQAGWTYSDKNVESNLQQSHLQNDGYRQQSAMKKDVIKWDGYAQLSNKERLDYIAFYANLYYQTPGGLTFNQFNNSDTTAYPLAVKQQAAIFNKTWFGGISLTSNFNNHFANTISAVLNHTTFKNPFTSDYEIRDELNYGGRTTFDYHISTKHIQLKLLAGAEWGQNHSHIDDYGNKNGAIDTVQFKDELFVTQYSLFTQLNIELNNKFTFQAGLSNNNQIVRYRRLTDFSQKNFVKGKTNNLTAPRFSILYKLTSGISLYAVAAKGFSPPALAELHPNSTFNDSLQPERGWNYELGIKGNIWQNRLLFDASVYSFKLNNAIVERINANNAEYYINAGSTNQSGCEIWLKGIIVQNQNTLFISKLSIANSFSYQPYTFTNYIVGSANYSGNKLTGVPQTINVTTIELNNKNGFYLNGILNNVSSIALSDANDEFAKPYHLLQGKIGFKHQINKLQYNFLAGADNLLNEKYSLGNDINAFGKRYYNPAAKRNYFAGVQLNF